MDELNINCSKLSFLHSIACENLIIHGPDGFETIVESHILTVEIKWTPSQTSVAETKIKNWMFHTYDSTLPNLWRNPFKFPFQKPEPISMSNTTRKLAVTWRSTFRKYVSMSSKWIETHTLLANQTLYLHAPNEHPYEQNQVALALCNITALHSNFKQLNTHGHLRSQSQCFTEYPRLCRSEFTHWTLTIGTTNIIETHCG